MLRKLLPLFVLFFFFTAQAQSAKDLVRLTWKGKSKQDADFTKQGYLLLEQSLTMTLGSDGKTITGTAHTKMTLDGKSYSSKTSISGTLIESTYTIDNFKDDYTISSDALPNGLRWCKGWGKLTFYKNSDKPGHYILKGNISDDCGGSSFIEFLDY